MTLRNIVKWSLISTGTLTAVIGYWGLANLQLTMNGTESLPEPAYLQWRWPKYLWHGAVVSLPPPAIFGHKLDGMSVVKRIGGLPGDPIRNFGHMVCVAGTCYEAQIKDGKPFAPLLPDGVVPDGKLAIFGDAPNSLDSRYVPFGLVNIADVEAVGFPLEDFPRWTEVAAWLAPNS